MLFRKPQPKIEQKEMKEVIGDRPGVKLRYDKLKKIVMQCEMSNRDELCKHELKSIGVDWIE